MTLEEKFPKETEVRVHYLMMFGQGYWAKALSPDAAEALMRSYGPTKAQIKKDGVIFRLPAGVTHSFVDGMGCLHWRLPEGQSYDVQSDRLTWNKKTSKWEEEAR